MPSVGDRVGRWRLEAPLGQGSFGATFRAVDDRGRLAALKVLGAPPGGELRALSRLCHPAIVQVLDGGGHPVPFLAMELAEGQPLSRVVRGGASEQEALGTTAVLADALAAVHHAGLSHGDVKPDNVIVRGDDVRLVDFGVAGASGSGGTPLYAAPERFRGKGISPEGDVYALGLVLWEMLHGALPWADLELTEALARRRRGIPEPDAGPSWAQELLARMLATNASHRPTAAEVADEIASHGAKIPSPGPDLVLRRAQTVHVPRPDVDDALATWLSDGGTLAVLGPTGSGRTHTLDAAATELRAEGRSWVRVVASARPWDGIERALEDPGLPGPPTRLPDAGDVEQRAVQAARALLARAPDGLVVLVDDHDALDPGTARTVAALATSGRAAVCASAEVAPDSAATRCVVGPLDDDGVRELVHGLLGATGGLELLVRRAADVSGGLPGPAIGFVVGAVRSGALVRRAQRWIVDELALDGVADALGGAWAPDRTVSPAARAMGAVLALHGLPIRVEWLARLAGLGADEGRDALQELVAADLVRVEDGHARCASRAASSALSRGCEDPAAIHRTLLAWLGGLEDVPLDRIGWHVVGAGDAEQAAAQGPCAVAAARERDPVDAARLADALWALAPVPALEAPRVEVLAAAGRIDEALSFGNARLDARSPSEADLPLLVALAALHVGVRQDHDAAMGCVVRARAGLTDAALPLALTEIEARAHFRAERYDDAVKVAEAACGGAPPRDLDERDRWMALRVVWAQAVQARGDVDGALAVLDGVPPVTDRSSGALVEGVRGRLLWHAGRLHEAGEALERAARREAGLPAVDRARNLNNAGLAAYLAGDRLGALARWEKALLLFERLGDEHDQVRVQVNLCVGYREAGRWERARQAGQWAVRRAAELSLPDMEGMAAGNLGDLALVRGDYRQAERWYARAAAIADAHELTGERVELARRYAELAVLRRDDDALARAEAAERVARDAGATFEACRAGALVAVCLARHGIREALAERIEAALAPLREAGAAGELAEVRLWAAEAWLAAGRPEDALAQVTRARLYAEEVGHVQLRIRADGIAKRVRPVADPDPRGPVLRVLALAERVARDPDPSSVLDAIAETALEATGGERAHVVLREGHGLTVIAARARDGGEVGEPSFPLVERVIESGRKVIAVDLDERAELRATASVVAMRLRSVLCVPMVHGDDVLGAIYVDSRSVGEQELTEADLAMRALAAHAAIAVTRHRAVRAAEERARSAAEVVHDIRNPLGAVLLAAEDRLRRHPDDPALATVVEGTRRAVSLARRFLDGQQGERRPVELATLSRRLVALHSGDALGRGIVVEVDATGAAPVLADEEDLARAVGNLISNAVKYSAPGGAVTVSVEADDREVRLSVRDRGPGLPAGHLDAVFEPGVQAPGALPGNGLGLGIARRIARGHGGDLVAENHPDGGAVFRLRLPRCTTDGERT